MEVYQHMWDNFLLLVDNDQEILKAKELLKVEYYKPDRIVQHYYRQTSNVRLLLTALRETVIHEDAKHNVYTTFEKHIDLKEACRAWNRPTSTT